MKITYQIRIKSTLKNREGVHLLDYEQCSTRLGTQHIQTQLKLPDSRIKELNKDLQGIPTKATCFSKHTWQRLIGIIISAVPTIEGSSWLFSRQQNILQYYSNRRLLMSVMSHYKMYLWWNLFVSLGKCSIKLFKIRPNIPTWIGATDASTTRMGGIWHRTMWDNCGQCVPILTTKKAHIVFDDNYTGGVTINNLDICS